MDEVPRVKSSTVLNSASNNLVLGLIRHHASNTNHINQTGIRIKELLREMNTTNEALEREAERLSMDLNSNLESLSECSMSCKKAMMKTRTIVKHLVQKEQYVKK